MNRNHAMLVAVLVTAVVPTSRAFAQQVWVTPAPAPQQPAPAPQPPPPPPQVDVVAESETGTTPAGEEETEPTRSDTNVNVEVGARTEGGQAPAAPAATPSTNAPNPGDEPQLARFLHGFRLGYLYIHDIEGPVDSENPSSQPYADRYGIRSPHMFMLGYELAVRLFGHDWLNMLLIGNILIAGFEQSRFFPSANMMLGFEFNQTAQLGVGVSLTPTKDDPAHIVVAAGWTPQVGEFYLPIHFFFVPDINGHHKIGATLGVTF